MAQTKRDLEQLVAATKQSATKVKDTQTAYNSFLTNVIRNYDGNVPYSVDARTTDFQNAASTGSLNASTLNSLLGNEPGDWRPKRGELANMDTLWDLAITQADYMDFARKNGVFDTEQYAFDRGSVSLPSTPYLQQLYTQMSDPAYQSAANAEHKKKSNITLLQDEWGRLYNGMREGEYGYPQLSNIANPDDNLLALTEWLISGGDTETDISGMSAEDLAAWRSAALKQYNDYGLSNEQTWSDLANGDYSVGDQPAYVRNRKLVGEEIARRQTASNLAAEAQALPGFDSISVYKDPYAATAVGTGEGQAYPSPMDYNLHMDDLQWMINNPPDHAYYLVKDDNPVIQNFFNQGYNLLTDREKGIYNAYIENNQPEKAAAFLEAIGPDLLQRRANANLWFNSSAASNPWLALPYYGVAALDNFYEGARSVITAAGVASGAISDNPNDSYFDRINRRDAVRPEQRDIFGDALNFEIAGHRVGELAYDALTGITDFGTAIGAATLMGNPMYAQYIMGGEAMASTTHEMLKRGWDGKAAAVAGMFAGAVETLFEHISLDKLFKMSPADGLGLFIATNGLVEASEEFNTDIFNPLAEAFVGYLFDEETNAQERYYDLVNNQKLTDKAASNVIFGEFLNSAAYSSAVGLIVGSASAGGRAGIETYANTRVGQPIASSETGEADLLSLAETMPEDSETKKILPTLKKTKGGKNVKSSELGRLARTMAAELDGESHSVLASATASVVRQHLNATGRAQDIHTAAQEVGTTPKVLAETIAKGVNGTRMNAEERRIFGKSNFAKSMVRELGLSLKAPTLMKQARLHSITNPTTQVEEQRENAAVVRATQLINPASNDPHSDHLVYEVDGQQAEGDILRFDEVDGELLVVVKDGDGNRAALSHDMITSMDGSTQATVVELVTSGGERISAPKANLMLRAAQYEKPESMASFLTAFDSVYDAGWYGRSMEAVEGLSSDLAEDVYALGQSEAKAAEEARATRDGAFKRVKGGLVTFLGNVKTREELVGEGTVDALTAIEGSLTETQRAHVEGIKAIAKALDAQIVLYSSDADSISDLPNGKYMPDTGLIYLDINAGAETAEGVEAARAAGTLGNAMATSLSHELTHAIERGSKQGYIDFKQAMIDQFKKRGGPTFEQLVQQKIGEQYANFGIRLTRQAAEAEVVAYGAELMLQNSDVIATLKPSLAEKIRTFIADFLKKVRNAFSIMPSLSAESSALVEMRDGVLKYADDLQKKWNIALQEAVGMEGEAVAAAEQEQAAEAAPAAEETQTTGNKNVQYSLRVVKPITPKSTDSSGRYLWERGHSESWFRENGYPIYEDVPEHLKPKATGKKGHGTQISTTTTTYMKLFERLRETHPDNWQQLRVLDASSGLGLGTIAGREMGFDVTDIEPFPGEGYNPDYTDYDLLQSMVERGEVEPFDFIISNAVLNVIPQDTRDNLVVAMGNLLRPGGQMFVNTLPKTYGGAIASVPPTAGSASSRKGSVRTAEGDYSSPGNVHGRGHETFVWGSNSVQKVFSYDELMAYLKDALGSDYSVAKDKLGMTGVLVRKSKNATTHQTSEEVPLVAAEEQALQSEDAPPSFDLIAALDGQDQPAGQSEALNEGSKAQASDGSGAQYSMRGRGDSITVREYVAEADESLATSNAERNALELYKKRLANYTAITRQLSNARAAVRQAESDEARAQAQANVNTLLGKRASAYDELVSAESTPHISQIMARTRSFMQENLAGKTREDLEALISRTEAEIAELTEMVAGLEKASRTQSRERKTIAAQLEEAKQSIEDKRRTIAQLRSRATERYLALRQHYKDRIERDRTRRQIMEESRKKERHVKKVVRRLHDKLVNESDTRNIKEPLKPVAIKLVNAFLEGFGRSVFSAQSTAKLYPLYQELAREAGVDTTEFASDISELFEILNETAVRYGEYASHGGNSIEQATLRLQIFDTLADIVDHVDALVRNADATFADGKRTTISLLSDSVYESLADRKNKRTLRGVAGKATQLFSDTTWMGNLLPTYFFEQLGNETLNDLFVDIRRGMSDSMRIVRDAQDFMQDLKKRKHYYSWRLGDTIDIHTAQGHDLHLPVEVAIALYVTAKRERTNTIAATRHLQDGGFRMDEDAAKKGLFNPEETSGFHLMSDEDIARLESLLTEDQKSYGDEIATYLAEHMGALGNQVSMATYGIRKYKESYYIPFVTASIQRAQSSSKGSTATTDDSRLAHQSFSHRLRTGANTALQIGNITDMALRHVYSMANYVGMATPIENLNRVLNHNIEAEDGSKSTIRAIFEQKYGKIALKYLEDLMRDVNGTTQSDSRSMGGINFLISAFKRGAVAGKLAVSLQQPTSIFRAAAYLGIRDFVGIPVARVPSAWQELLKYSGTAIAKDMGRYDIGLGQTAVEYMAQDDMTGYNIFQRVQNRTIKENWKSFTDLTTALPGFMDQFAWVNIFAMVKREQARLHPGMDTSSEEFLKLCGERFDDVVYHTQVFDSVLSRSSLMRSPNALHKMATSFMAEPTMTVNMIRSAIFAKHTKAERAKIVVSCLVATIGASAAGALVGGFNKDDDDRTWWEKYLSNFTSRAIDGLNPMSLFPYFNALSDLLEGYETERLDTAVFGDIVTHVKQAYNGNLTPWKTVELLGGDIANLFGLPLGGVMGDMRRIRNAITSSKAAVPADELKFSVLEAAPYGWYKGGTTAYYERMAAAAINGDMAEVQAIRNYLLRAHQSDGSKIDSGMKSAMKDRFVAGDVPEGDAINVLVSYGLAKDKSDAYWQVDQWEHIAETGSSDGYGKYNDFIDAVRTGKNLKNVTSIYLNNGVTQKTLSDSITDAFKKEYVQLYKTDKRAAAALKARLLTAYELLGYDRTKKSKDIDRWIKD